MLDQGLLSELADKFIKNLSTTNSINTNTKTNKENSESSLLKEDIAKTFKLVLEGALNKLDLVTRHEFDVQAQVLADTKQQLETLSEKIAQKEQRD